MTGAFFYKLCNSKTFSGFLVNAKYFSQNTNKMGVLNLILGRRSKKYSQRDKKILLSFDIFTYNSIISLFIKKRKTYFNIRSLP